MSSLLYIKQGILLLVLLITTQLFATNRSTNKPSLKFELFPNNAPLSYINDDGHPDGFYVDMANAIVNVLKDSCQIVFIQPKEDVAKIAYHDSLSVYVLVHSKERAESFHFSSAFANLYYDIVVRDNNDYKRLSDLSGKRVIVKEHAVSRSILEAMGPDFVDNLILVPNMEVGLKMLSGGEGDAALCSSVNAANIIEEAGLTNLVKYESEIPVQELCFASKNYLTIMNINEAINSLIRSGEYDKIYFKWFGNKDNAYLKYVFVLFVLLVFVALFLLALWWYLKSRIKIKTQELVEYNKQVFELNQLINMLVDESDITMFVYEMSSNQLFTVSEGKFVEYPYTLKEIETFIHVDDKGRYDKCWEDIATGVRDKVVCSLRVYEREIGKYCDYEYVVNGHKNDAGEVVKIIYSRRDESRHRQILRKQDENILNLDLALYSAKLIRWQYDIISDTHKMIDYDSNKFTVTDQQWLDLIAPEDHADYIRFIDSILEEGEKTGAVTIHAKLPESAEYKPYELTAVSRYNKNGELLSLHGILNDVSTITNFQSQLNEKVEVLNAINNHIPVGITFLDIDGFVIGRAHV